MKTRKIFGIGKKTLLMFVAMACVLLYFSGCGNLSRPPEAPETEGITEAITAQATPAQTAAPTPEATPEPVIEEETEQMPEDPEGTEEPLPDANGESPLSGIRPEFKEAMDSYEAFYDEYCQFMTDFKENPTDMTLLLQYTEMLGRLEEMNAAFDAWESEEMSNEELAYYLEVTARIEQKLIGVM